MSVQVQYLGSKSEIESMTGVPTDAKALTTDGEFGIYNGTSWEWQGTLSGATVWGSIIGSIFDQTDLMAELNGLDERIDDKQDSNENTDALYNGTQANDTFLYKESGDINGKTIAEVVALLKPILDTLYEPKTP